MLIMTNECTKAHILSFPLERSVEIAPPSVLSPPGTTALIIRMDSRLDVLPLSRLALDPFRRVADRVKCVPLGLEEASSVAFAVGVYGDQISWQQSVLYCDGQRYLPIIYSRMFASLLGRI